MPSPIWIQKLKQKWNLQSAWQVVTILVVFACTGFTILFIKKPLLNFLVGRRGDTVLASIIYYVLILPIYNIFLLMYGFVFGQFKFFWEFEKRSFSRIFKRRKK